MQVKVLIGLWLASVKFSQLFMLTWDPNTLAKDSFPEIVVQFGDIVLFDIDNLAKQSNSSFQSSLDNALSIGLSSNVTAGASSIVSGAIGDAVSFISSEDAYLNKTLIFFFLCIAMMGLILAAKLGGCLEGRGSETAQNLILGLVGAVASFVTIPLYQHLLSALDCTYQPSGMGPHRNESGFEWDHSPAAFGAEDPAEDHSRRECYGSWQKTADFGGWGAFNYMVFGMIGLCMYHWPITLYLMVRPDSARDDEEAVSMIADEVIRAKQLPGRTLEVPDESTGAVTKLSDTLEPVYLEAKERSRCCWQCRSLRRHPGYEKAKIVYCDEARAEYEKMYAVEELSEKQKQRGLRPRTTPTMNRLELRRWAVLAGVDPQVIYTIDHRRACGMTRNLDNPKDGILLATTQLDRLG